MRILLLNSHLNVGGITGYILALARGLRRRGHEVQVAASGGVWESKFAESGIPVFRVPLYTKSILSIHTLRSFWRLSFFLKKTPVDIAHGNSRVSQFMAFLLWKYIGIPYVCTFHGKYQPKLGRRLFPSEGLCSIAISSAVGKQMVETLGIAESKVRVVHHGLDEGQYASSVSREAVRKKYSLAGDPVIGIIARFAPEKNHRVLVEAFDLLRQRYPRAVLVLAGQGRLESEIKRMIARKGLNGHTRFLDGVTSQEILPAFDVSVLPSLEEGFGLAVLESFLLGVPVVVSSAGGLADIVEDNVTGLVLKDPTNPSELRDHLIRLIENPALKEKLIAAGKASARERFSKEQMLEKTEAVYREVLREEGRAT